MFLLGRVPLPDDLLQMVLGELDLVGQLLLELLEVAGLEPRLGEEIMTVIANNNDKGKKTMMMSRGFRTLRASQRDHQGQVLPIM